MSWKESVGNLTIWTVKDKLRGVNFEATTSVHDHDLSISVNKINLWKYLMAFLSLNAIDIKSSQDCSDSHKIFGSMQTYLLMV